MVTAGALVKEHCSIESKARMGTIVKVTRIQLHTNSQWESEVKRWTNANPGSARPMTECYVVRPGQVASVRWQDDPTSLTVHIFYDDCVGESFYSYGSNSVEIVK